MWVQVKEIYSYDRQQDRDWMNVVDQKHGDDEQCFFLPTQADGHLPNPLLEEITEFINIKPQSAANTDDNERVVSINHEDRQHDDS